MLLRVLLLLTCSLLCLRNGSAQRLESIWYTGGDASNVLDDFRAHASQISILSPQAYRATPEGDVLGSVDPDVLAQAKKAGVRLMPLIHNRGFNQENIHRLLSDSTARARSIESMVRLGQENEYWGWQFDYENIHVSDRDALTVYFRETATALHKAGMILSIAVVPTNGSDGESSFAKYMQDNWRNSFDMKALADAGDFISLMTYAQHGGPTAPGPIGGLPWMREMIDYALDQGVPPEKISLGIPSYSGYWRPVFTDDAVARVGGREVSYQFTQERLAESGAKLRWLPDQGVSYAFWQNEGVFEWLFLEDSRSLKSKMDLYYSYPGFRGISVWVLGAEDPGVWEVLAAPEPR